MAPEPSARRSAHPPWRTLLRLGATAGMLAYLLHAVGPGAVWQAVASVEVEALVVSFGTIMVMQVAIAYRLAVLMRALGAAVPTRHVLAINLSTVFYGLALPGGPVAGSALRFFRLSRAGGARGRALLAVVYDRLLATAAIGTMGLACWLLDGEAWSSAALGMLLVGSIALPASLVVPKLVPPGDAPARGRLGRLVAAFRVVRDVPTRTMLRLLAISVLAQVPAIASFIVLLVAVGVDLGTLTATWVRSAVTLVSALPVTIGGLGVREASMLFLLRSRGVPDEAALALSLLVFAVSFVGVAIVGAGVEAALALGRRRAPRA